MAMNREDAIQELQNCKGLIQQDGQDYLDERDIPLLDMAIEALNNSIQMSNIQELQAENGFLKEMVKFYREQQTYPNIEMNFCPNCGKRMIGNKKKEENNDAHKVPLYVYASWDRSEK